MKKGANKLLLLVLILSLTSIFLTNLVAAQSVGDKILQPITKFFTDWSEGNFPQAMAKWLFAFIVIVIIYGTLGVVPIVKEKGAGIKALLAFVIGFLATAYITPSEVYTVLTGYSAMALIFGAIVPFVLLIYLSIELRKDTSMGGIFLSYILWIGFIGFLAWKIYEGKSTGKITDVQAYLYAGIIGLSVISMMMVRFIEKGLRRSGITMKKEALMQEVEEAEAIARANKKRLSGAGGLRTEDEKGRV